MNANVGRDTAGFLQISFPGSKIPLSPGGNIGKIDIINLILRTIFNLFSNSMIVG